MNAVFSWQFSVGSEEKKALQFHACAAVCGGTAVYGLRQPGCRF
jgi:hypothetical protein